MRAFVDQISDGQALLLLGDDESISVTVPVAWLPLQVHEGQVLRFDIAVDQQATDAGKCNVKALMDDLGDEP